jgi:hypothetical protein
MSAGLEKARADAHAAGQAWSAALKARTTAFAEVEAFHGPVIERLRQERIAAEAAVAAAVSEVTPDHEWEGRRVFCEKKKWTSWGSPSGPIRLDGVVFTYRPGVDLGQGHKYTSPRVGDPFVRLLKKDGKPGSKAVTLRSEKWQLVGETGGAA